MKISLLSDQAIGEGPERVSDGLGFEAYAQVLADAASDTPGPFTIGIFGEWGTGKTSLMRLIGARLDKDPNVVTVWFNAWRYEKEEHPIVPLVGTIVQALEKEHGPANKLGNAAKSLIRSLRAIAYGFSAKSTVKVPGFAEVEASFVAKDIIDRDERLTPDPLLDKSLYYGAFEGLDSARLDDRFKIVIIIDDLDRCFPDQAIKLLESIKLVLAQPGFIFILGVAREVLEGYLQHRYTSEYGIANFKGHLYLDKMVQLPFHIPPTGSRMTLFCESVLEEQPVEVTGELRPVLPIVAEALGGNPRAMIRFINNLLIDMAVSLALAEAEHATAIPIQYFAISRCLEHRWPDVLATLMGSDQLSAQVATWTEESLVDRAQGQGPSADVSATLVAERELFRLFLSPQGQEWLTQHPLRHASIAFLTTQQRFSNLDTAEVEIRYDIFISYNHRDRNQVILIADLLSKAGLRVFLDRDLRPGQNWVTELSTAIYSSEMICICIGAELMSDSQQRELTGVLNSARHGKLIVPILLPGSSFESLPLPLSTIQVLDLRQGVDPNRLQPVIDIFSSHSRRS